MTIRPDSIDQVCGKGLSLSNSALCSSEIWNQPCVWTVCLHSSLFSSGRAFLKLLTFTICPLLTLDGLSKFRIELDFCNPLTLFSEILQYFSPTAVPCCYTYMVSFMANMPL